MAPEALPGWGGLCSHHEHNPWEMAQGLITLHQPADLSWIPLGRLGGREPSLPWAKASTAVMLVQSTEPQAAQEQEECIMPHPNMLLQTPKHVMEQKKKPLPQKTQRIIHLSKNGTSICKRRSTNIRFALSYFFTLKRRAHPEGSRVKKSIKWECPVTNMVSPFPLLPWRIQLLLFSGH